MARPEVISIGDGDGADCAAVGGVFIDIESLSGDDWGVVVKVVDGDAEGDDGGVVAVCSIDFDYVSVVTAIVLGSS